MPRDLFGDVTRPSISVGTRKWYTVPLSLLSHAVVVAAVVVVPLMAADVLPQPWQPVEIDYMPAVPTPPPPPPLMRRATLPPSAVDSNVPPVEAPSGISQEKPLPETGWEGTTPVDSIVGGNSDVVIAPPPPPPTIARQEPVRPGGHIRAPQKTHDVRPVYPQLALAARVQGIVIVEATIGVDGRVVNARILRSVPLLDQAALDAVRQWEYVPTMLNGIPVPVIMSVTVTFQLK